MPKLARCSKLANFNSRRVLRDAFSSFTLLNIATDHERNDRVVRYVIFLQDARVLTVPQDDHSVSDLADLAQTMGYVNNAHTLASKFLDDREQAIRFRQREARRRFVENQDARIL